MFSRRGVARNPGRCEADAKPEGWVIFDRPGQGCELVHRAMPMARGRQFCSIVVAPIQAAVGWANLLAQVNPDLTLTQFPEGGWVAF